MARGNFGNLTPQRVSKAARRGEAFKLLQAGFTETEILRKLSYTDRKQLKADLRKSMAEVNRPATQWMALQTARYEALLRSVWDDALGGDLKAVAEARQVIGDESKLLDLGGASVPDNSDVAAFMSYLLTAQEAISDDIDEMDDK